MTRLARERYQTCDLFLQSVLVVDDNKTYFVAWLSKPRFMAQSQTPLDHNSPQRPFDSASKHQSQDSMDSDLPNKPHV